MKGRWLYALKHKLFTKGRTWISMDDTKLHKTDIVRLKWFTVTICDLKCMWLNPKGMIHGWQDQPFYARKQTDHSKSHRFRWFWSDLLCSILDTARAACSKCRWKSRDLHARSGGLGLGSGSCCSLDFHTFCGPWWHWSFWFTQNGSADALRNRENKKVLLPGAILLRDDARLRRDWFQELYLQWDFQSKRGYIEVERMFFFLYNSCVRVYSISSFTFKQLKASCGRKQREFRRQTLTSQ